MTPRPSIMIALLSIGLVGCSSDSMPVDIPVDQAGQSELGGGEVHDFSRAPTASVHSDAYRGLQDEIAASQSPVAHLLRTCGSYVADYSAGPTPATAIVLEERRFTEYERCADAAIRLYDVDRRAAELRAFSVREESLAILDGAVPGHTAMRSVQVEMDAARHVVFRAYRAYQDRVSEIVRTATHAEVGGMRVEAGSAEVLVGPDMFELGGNLSDGLPPSEGVATDLDLTLEDTSGPPLEPVAFLTRLLPNGANMEIGSEGGDCVADLPCEVGRIVPLIAVRAYCEAPGQVSETTAGWALVVQRYQIETRDEELRLMSPVEGSRVHALADRDDLSLQVGLAEMRQKGVFPSGDQIFFTQWHDYFLINGQEKGCGDAWRDSAQHKVGNNRL